MTRLWIFSLEEAARTKSCSIVPRPPRKKASYLLERNRSGVLTGEEANELEQLGQIEHLFQLVKARAAAPGKAIVTSSYVSANLRQLVRQRARTLCEYCRLAEEDAFFAHEPDHIIAEKHGGQTIVENLALSCFDCNRFKGSDIASLDLATGKLVPLFNPRTDRWGQHFQVVGGRILALTAVGRATERLLKFNLPARVRIRAALAGIRRYPG